MNAFGTPDITAQLMRVQQNAQMKTALPETKHVSDADKATLKTKAKEFEAFFIYQTMELMKSGIESEFSGGHAEEMFRHTLNEHMAEKVTDAGGFGIADVVYAQLLKNQETRNATLAAARAAGQAYAGVAR